MPARRPLQTVILIQDAAVRSRCLNYLGDLCSNGRLPDRLPQFDIHIQICDTQEDAVAALHQHFDGNAAALGLIISDQLAEVTGKSPNEVAMPRSWMKEEIVDRFDDHLLGTLAIMDRRRRVPDVDRVLWQNFDSEALLNVIGLVGDKLAYVMPPERPLPCTGVGVANRWRKDDPIVVRAIRDLTELREYYRLRFRVYRIMGYLEDWAESATTGMEINAEDTHALHVGAFVRDGSVEKLIGTARVVSMEPLDDRFEEWTRKLAASDPALKTKLHQHHPLGLPVFQSMKDLTPRIIDALTAQQNWGELSRIIVSEDYRGKGVSELLVWFSILQAAERGVSQFLLECLPLHERLYGKFGFARVPGVTGQVIGVEKKMMVMELSMLALDQLKGRAAVGRMAQVIRNIGYLRSCHDARCVLAECGLYTDGTCAAC